MIKKPEKIEKVDETPVIQPVSDPRETMIAQRDEYLALLKRLQDEGIINIGVLENKIASLNKAIG